MNKVRSRKACKRLFLFITKIIQTRNASGLGKHNRGSNDEKWADFEMGKVAGEAGFEKRN